MTIRTTRCIVTMAAAVVAMAAGCSPAETAHRTAAAVIPSTPQRALRIYPVGTLIVDVTSRPQQPIDGRVAETQLAQRGEGVQEAR